MSCSDKQECCPEKQVLVNYVFNKHTIQQVEADFANPAFIVNDGTWQVVADGLNVRAVPFKYTIPQGNEHPKNLHYWNEDFVLSDCYETLYETEISVTQVIPVEKIPVEFLPRIRNIQEDIRLCCGGINTLDVNTWIVSDILMSNEKVYCFAERLPFGQDPNNRYAAYSNAVAVIERPAPNKDGFIKLGIGLKKSGASYYINGRLVFQVPYYGLRQLDEYRLLDHQGKAEKVKIQTSAFGFGLFSLMDMQLPYNYARQLVVNDFATNQLASGLVQLDLTSAYGETLPGKNGDDRPVIDPAVTWAIPFNASVDNTKYKLFGQGAEMTLKYFRVSRIYK